MVCYVGAEGVAVLFWMLVACAGSQNKRLFFTTLRCKSCPTLAFVEDPTPRMEVERNYEPPPTGEYLYKLLFECLVGACLLV